MSRHVWKSPRLFIAGMIGTVTLVGGLYRTLPSAQISRSPIINALLSSSQPNCLRAISDLPIACSSSTHLVTYDISKSCLFPSMATPCCATALINFSLDSAEVSGNINSRTPSLGKCNRSRSVSPSSGSWIRFTTYISYG